MEKSLLVGDKLLDIKAGKKAGIKTCLVSSCPDPRALSPKPDLIVPDLAALAELILKKENGVVLCNKRKL